MVQLHKQFYNLLRAAVNSINTTDVEVVYDKFITTTSVPCVSYLQLNNSELYPKDTLGYASVSFMVKVWARDLETTLNISNTIERKLADAGFHLTSAQDTLDNNYIMQILIFTCVGYEK